MLRLGRERGRGRGAYRSGVSRVAGCLGGTEGAGPVGLVQFPAETVSVLPEPTITTSTLPKQETSERRDIRDYARSAGNRSRGREGQRTLSIVVVEDEIHSPRLQDLDTVIRPVVEDHLAEDGQIVRLPGPSSAPISNSTRAAFL
jgi:hypothetical protein